MKRYATIIFFLNSRHLAKLFGKTCINSLERIGLKGKKKPSKN